MKAFDTYKKYVSIKLHFNSDKYDYVQSKGSINVSQQNFEKRKDYYYFQKLSSLVKTDEELENLLVANFLKNDKMWIGDLITEESKDVLYARLKIQQALEYFFKNEIAFLGEEMKENDSVFVFKNNKLPRFIKYHQQNLISYETFIILDDHMKLINHFDKILLESNYSMIWMMIRKNILKYKPFLKYDSVIFKKIINNFLATMKTLC